MMADDGVAARLLSFAAAIRSCGAPYYILQRTVVLNKVEVRSGNRAKWKAEVAHYGDSFQKNLGQQNGGAPIQIDAAGMHLLHERAEEAEVQVRGGAESGAVGGAVHVRNVRADGEVHGDGNAKLVRGGQDAGVRVGDVDHRV